MKMSRGTGDKGETSLFGGERVGKGHARIEACGDVDELNCVLGVLIANLPEGQTELEEEVRAIQSDLMHLGALLATTSVTKISASVEEIVEQRTVFLEKATDSLDESLPKLTGFILPGGHVSGGWAHVARTVCRRAERRVVRLFDGAGGDHDGGPRPDESQFGEVPTGEGHPGGGQAGKGHAGEGRAGDGLPGAGNAVDDPAGRALRKAAVYLNRLSDYLFVLARYCNRLAGVQDVPWRK